ncbi:methylenetetrahydrofolate reductase [Herbidospora daliensis]|uniref:methylenetetrahydrofolate reductase n=1 Tax=Herbidospora daliensis TaxID=295585 RepID=UPI00078434FA|nr:methylenetetrahydrofolate reductase [Herbidospora daliensis]
MYAISYEILPFRDAEESVLTHVPPAVPLTVTATEAKGLGPTLDLAVRLTGSGYTVSPHLAARLVRDEQELTDIVARLKDGGVDGVFVIGGDAPEPAGRFPDALSLLEALAETGHHFRRVGIGGYPEGHGTIDRELIDRALALKTPHATHVITQMCFDARTTLAWARDVHLPVVVGLPGAVTRQKLIRISAGLGLGRSARFLRKQQNLAWRLLLPGYRPNRLIAQLAPHVGGLIAGFHLFTFNELAKTEAWRRSLPEPDSVGAGR